MLFCFHPNALPPHLSFCTHGGLFSILHCYLLPCTTSYTFFRFAARPNTQECINHHLQFKGIALTLTEAPRTSLRVCGNREPIYYEVQFSCHDQSATFVTKILAVRLSWPEKRSVSHRAQTRIWRRCLRVKPHSSNATRPHDLQLNLPHFT